MNYGEVLSYITSMGKTKVRPFKTWSGSQVKEWEFEIELLDVGKNIEVSKATADLPITAMFFGAKVETLARCIISINGESFGSQEQLDGYNKEHNLEGDKALSAIEYKKLLIRKWDQVVINALDSEYNKLQEDQVKKLLGATPEEKEEAAKEVGVKNKVSENATDENAVKNAEVSKKDSTVEIEAYVKTKKDA
jgi:hypothetical protein